MIDALAQWLQFFCFAAAAFRKQQQNLAVGQGLLALFKHLLLVYLALPIQRDNADQVE